MIALLLSLALAAPSGYTQSKDTGPCKLFLGPSGPGGTPMHAECHWPNLTKDHLVGLMSSWPTHAAIFTTVSMSKVERSEGTKAWVRQIHQASGISDREVLLVTDKVITGDTTRFTWKLDPSMGEPSEKRVKVAYDVGYWEFSTHPDGGVQAVHHLEYDPGGRVPGFLVRWFQTSGLENVVKELETYAKAH